MEDASSTPEAKNRDRIPHLRHRLLAYPAMNTALSIGLVCGVALGFSVAATGSDQAPTSG